MHPADRRFLVTVLAIVLLLVAVAVLGATGQLGYDR
jgi:hypothetical protein